MAILPVNAVLRRPKVLVTGASGFVGRALVSHLEARNDCTVRSVVRGRAGEVHVGGQVVAVGNLSGETDWSEALQGVDVVVHVAARTQVIPGKTAAGKLDEFREVNVEATLALAAQASAAGVRRFVFISSVKVLGESSQEANPLKDTDPYNPADAYGVSKMEAEQGLRALLQRVPMELVIIRPPLVYGPGMQSNFGVLMGAVTRGLPLPLANVDNRRSFIGIDNLVDFIHLCISHPEAANRAWMVSDHASLSTPALIRSMAVALDVRPFLLPFPILCLRWAAWLTHKGSFFERLCGNLEVDITPARRLLGWTPPVALEEGLRRVVVAPVSS